MISSDTSYGDKRKAERLRRERLFRKSRPFLRPLDLKMDLWILWAAYDLGSFPQMPQGLDPSQFGAVVAGAIKARSSALVIEDDCKWFKTGRGPVALILIDNYGWQIQPFADFFKWATPRIKLRSAVAFFQKLRHDSAVGVCMVKSHEKRSNLLTHMQKYGVLWRCGKVPSGYPDGDEYLFQVRGKRDAGTHGAGRHSEVQRGDRVPGPENPGPERAVPPRPEPVLREPERATPAGRGESPDSDHRQRESDPAPVMPVMPKGVDVELRQARIRDWA